MDINLGSGRSLTVREMSYGVTTFTPIEEGPYRFAAEDCVNRILRNPISHNTGKEVLKELNRLGFVLFKITEKEESSAK
jgi:hypothetical protein